MCAIDGDPVDVYDESFRVARKQHCCEDCPATIAPGERYRHTTVLFEGQWSRHRHCTECVEIADAVRATGCSWLLGELRDNARAALWSGEHGHEAAAVGRLAGLLFAAAERRREAMLRRAG
jgi:hypothetical protein